MKTWLDLEARFRALEPALQYSRLDAQWGAAGEYWRVAGTVSPTARQEYELLSALGGRWLEQALSPKKESDQVLLGISDPLLRWYSLLKASSPSFGDRSYGQQVNEDGSNAGFIYTGSMHSIGISAANLCLALQTSNPIREKKSAWAWLHENYVKAVLVGIVVAIVGALAKAFIGA